MRRLRDVLAMFVLGIVAGSGAVAFAIAVGPEPATIQAGSTTSPVATSPLPANALVEEVVLDPTVDGDLVGLPGAMLRTLARHGALEQSTGSDLEEQLHPAIVAVLVHRRGALAVFEDAK